MELTYDLRSLTPDDLASLEVEASALRGVYVRNGGVGVAAIIGTILEAIDAERDRRLRQLDPHRIETTVDLGDLSPDDRVLTFRDALRQVANHRDRLSAVETTRDVWADLLAQLGEERDRRAQEDAEWQRRWDNIEADDGEWTP